MHSLKLNQCEARVCVECENNENERRQKRIKFSSVDESISFKGFFSFFLVVIRNDNTLCDDALDVVHFLA